jgi:hypothetical protein
MNQTSCGNKMDELKNYKLIPVKEAMEIDLLQVLDEVVSFRMFLPHPLDPLLQTSSIVIAIHIEFRDGGFAYG